MLHAKIKKYCRFIISVAFFVITICVAPVEGGDTLKKVSFIPQWVPQAQFAGYYIGLEKGIYRKYGIDLTIITGGQDSPPSDLLMDGGADFASLWLSTGIQMRAGGAKIFNIAQIMQRSALMLVAKKASGIEKPSDMNGKKVGLWGPVFQLQPRAFFRKYNLTMQIIPQSFSVNLFLRDGVDVASAMWYNEYHTIMNCGINPDELTTFFFHEHGLNFPEDGIYVLEETYRKDPALCGAFVLASIEGWQYAFDHPDEALAVTMRNLKKEHIPTTLVHQKWMLERMKDLILPENGEDTDMGGLQIEDYSRVARGLRGMELIDSVPSFTSFYKVIRDKDEK
ncbi:MAG: NitT/TauT family transport system substrate-binding protein [Desulfobacteraceae bacterium Eth-SRB1]|nr:MAG: NitT/TauT family transport system substrate-binding protein [Desulfobacteraceae bacterium Eth-SRB1]